MRKRKLLPVLKQNGLWKRRSAKVARKEPALPPGSLVHIGERMTEAFSLRLIAYDRDHLEKLETQKIDASLRSRKEQGATWLHVTGLHEVDKIAELAGLFEVHPLVTEDILNSRQRAKIEIHDDYVFVVSKVAEFEANGQVVSSALLPDPDFRYRDHFLRSSHSNLRPPSSVASRKVEAASENSDPTT